jgi:hypothetical protein
MKSFLLIVITTVIMGFSSIIHAQEYFTVMSNTKNNFVFKGLQNPIEFYCSFELNEIKVIGGRIDMGYDVKDNILSEKSASEKFWRNVQKEGNFLLIPDCDAKSVEVILVGKKSSMSKYFSSLRVPNPLVRFAGQLAANNTISASAVRSARTIDVYQAEDFVYTGLNYNTADFKVQITHEGKTEEFVCQGNLSHEAMVATSKLQVGDRIVIYDVNVTGACGLIHLEDRLDLLVE